MVTERREHAGINSTGSSSFSESSDLTHLLEWWRTVRKYNLNLTTHATVVRISVTVTVILSALLPVSHLGGVYTRIFYPSCPSFPRAHHPNIRDSTRMWPLTGLDLVTGTYPSWQDFFPSLTQVVTVSVLLVDDNEDRSYVHASIDCCILPISYLHKSRQQQ